MLYQALVIARLIAESFRKAFSLILVEMAPFASQNYINASQVMERALRSTAPLELLQWLRCALQTAQRSHRKFSLPHKVDHAQNCKPTIVNLATAFAQHLSPEETVNWDLFHLLRNALRLVVLCSKMSSLNHGELEFATQQFTFAKKETAIALFLLTVNCRCPLLRITALLIAVLSCKIFLSPKPEVALAIPKCTTATLATVFAPCSALTVFLDPSQVLRGVMKNALNSPKSSWQLHRDPVLAALLPTNACLETVNAPPAPTPTKTLVPWTLIAFWALQL